LIAEKEKQDPESHKIVELYGFLKDSSRDLNVLKDQQSRELRII